MAKKSKTIITPAAENAISTAQHTTGTSKKWEWDLRSFRMQALILVLIGLLFYANSFVNEYALDDNPIIIDNEYVQSGITGIPSILKHDAMEKFFERNNATGKLTGGRYRPLSIISFAIEQQILGPNVKPEATNAAEQTAYHDKLVSDMHFRHVINVLLYLLAAVVLLVFLRKIVFPADPLAAFIAAIIFVIHPIHTEVVANVKSRDEIMSLLFICLTFIKAFQYKDTGKKQHLLATICYFFLALLSKEYAVTLLVLLPLALFVLGKYSIKESVRSAMPLLAPFAIYVLLRVSSVVPAGADAGSDVLNNPYLYASAIQKSASVIAVLFDYLKLLVLPYPLSSDYSYNQIPYSDFSSIKVWGTLLLYAAMIVYGYILTKKRHPAAFGIWVLLVFLLLVSNIFFNIGATMGERLIYHSSLGFAILFACITSLIYKKATNAATAHRILIGFMSVVIIVAAFITIGRNADWKSDMTLFLKDVQTVPNSAVANQFAGAACVKYSENVQDEQEKKDWLRKGLAYLNKALQIHKKYTDGYLNRGVAYYKLGEYEKALADCDTVTLHFPQHPGLGYLSYVVSDHYFNMAIARCKVQDFPASFPLFRKALEASPRDPELWYNMGYAYYCNKEFDKAKDAANMALKFNANFPRAITLLNLCKPKEDGKETGTP